MSTSISELPVTKVTKEDDKILLNRKENNRAYNYTILFSDLKTLLKIPTRESLGVANVDNTRDLDKPLSTAMKDAIAQLANKVHSHKVEDVDGLITRLTQLSDRIVFLENSVDVNVIKANIEIAIREALAQTNFNNHTQHYDTIIGLEELISNSIATALESVETTVNELMSVKIIELEEEVNKLKQSVSQLPVNQHRHVISDVEGLQWYLERMVLAPLDPDNGVIEDNW